MAIMKNAIPLISTAEGGEVNSKNDAGRLTKYGISQRAYPDLDIANLTFDQAMAILEKDYWDKYRIGEIENQDIANTVMLIFINMDPRSAATIIQKAIIRYSAVLIPIDGIMGSETLSKINTIISTRYYRDCLRLECCQYYLDLVDADEKQLPNFHGWIRRSLL
jgi:lysozyme family protein